MINSLFQELGRSHARRATVAEGSPSYAALLPVVGQLLRSPWRGWTLLLNSDSSLCGIGRIESVHFGRNISIVWKYCSHSCLLHTCLLGFNLLRGSSESCLSHEGVWAKFRAQMVPAGWLCFVVKSTGSNMVGSVDHNTWSFRGKIF